MTARRLRTAALLTTAALLVAACGGSNATPAPSATATPAATSTATPAPTATPAATPSPTPEATETPTASGGSIGGERGRVELAADGFAITLADGWVSLPLDEEALLEVIDNIPDDVLSAQLKAQVPTIIASGMKFWAIDESTNGAANINVLVIAQPLAMDMATLKSVASQGLTMIGADTESVEIVDVDGTEGVKAVYALSSTSGGQTVNVSGTQIYAQNGGKLYIMSFSDGLGNASNDIEAMIETIELLP